MDKRYQVVIIGAGPAGVACALQLKRHGIASVLTEQENVGGLLRNANLVENYPGFPRGIPGPELVRLFQEQLKNSGVEVTRERVLGMEYREDSFFVRTDRRMIQANFAVLATGTKPRNIPDLTFPAELADRVFYEVFPLTKIHGKTIAIIGAGDAAFDYALNLAAGNEVTILNRGEQVAGLPLLYHRCMVQDNISYLKNTRIEEIALRCGRIDLSCLNESENKRLTIIADYLLIAVGREPNLDLLGGLLTEKYQTLINDGKLYLIGDVNNGRYRQTAISVGDGIKAAMKIAARAGAAG